MVVTFITVYTYMLCTNRYVEHEIMDTVGDYRYVEHDIMDTVGDYRMLNMK
jgi:UDP-3-O-acyl-N-acetylglucosamine deacetylase